MSDFHLFIPLVPTRKSDTAGSSTTSGSDDSSQSSSLLSGGNGDTVELSSKSSAGTNNDSYRNDDLEFITSTSDYIRDSASSVSDTNSSSGSNSSNASNASAANDSTATGSASPGTTSNSDTLVEQLVNDFLNLFNSDSNTNSDSNMTGNGSTNIPSDSNNGIGGIVETLQGGVNEINNDYHELTDVAGKDAGSIIRGAISGWGLSSGGLGNILLGVIDYVSQDSKATDRQSLFDCVKNEYEDSGNSVIGGLSTVLSWFGIDIGNNNTSVTVDTSTLTPITIDTSALTNTSWTNNIDFGGSSDAGISNDSGNDIGSNGGYDYYSQDSQQIANTPIELNGLSAADINALTDLSWANNIDFGTSSVLNWGLTAGGCIQEDAHMRGYEWTGLC